MLNPYPFHPAVTGFGMIASCADGCAEARALIRGERSPKSPIPACGRVRTSIADPVFPAPLELAEEDGASRTLRLLEHALKEALENASLSSEPGDSVRTACVVGTTVAVRMNDLKSLYPKLRADKTFCPEMQPGEDPAAALCAKHGWSGPAYTISNACSSGADAVSVATLLLLSGECDRAIVAGADALDPVPIAGFHSLGITSASPCRPFDKSRSGLNLGEGAAVLILERPDSANRRGFQPRFQLRGFGMASDAFHMTAPNGDGLRRAIETAFSRAGIEKKDIAFINAHGTGTEINDRCESQLFFELFGRMPYLSTKGVMGHTLGAAGTLELVSTFLMLDEGVVPPSQGFAELPDDIPYPPIQTPLILDQDARYALSTSLAFGGCSSALIAERMRFA